MKFLKLGTLLAALIVVFGMGVFTGVYRTFPWDVIRPAGEAVTGAARAIGLMGKTTQTESAAQPEVAAEGPVLFTTLLQNFDMQFANNSDPIEGSAGGITITPWNVLIARDQEGVVHAYDPATNLASPSAILLPPTNRRAAPTAAENGHPLNRNRIRYNDIHYMEWDGEQHLAVAYNYFNPDNMCFTLRMSRTVLPEGWAEASQLELEWSTAFETAPCMPIHSGRRHAYAGHQSGGAIDDDGNGNLYLTVGDYEYDGRNDAREPWPQRLDNDYGKIYAISPEDDVDLISFGHRNPQGLVIDPAGRIFSVEHSAQGGDELNLVRNGLDYGWPSVNLGIDYGDLSNDDKAWAQNPQQGRHAGFEAPIFAWIPSTAPSSVAYVGPDIPKWEGDLLVGTLAGQSIRRLRLDGDNVIYEEILSTDARVRDIAVDGTRIIALYDDGRLAVMNARLSEDRDEAATLASPSNQDDIFEAYGCAECHSAPSSPKLDGLLGTPVASQNDATYTDALRAIEGVWTPENLASFLEDPQNFAPGTSMPDPGLTPDNIDALIIQMSSQ